MLREIDLKQNKTDQSFLWRFSHTSHILGNSKLILVGGVLHQTGNTNIKCSRQSITIIDLKTHQSKNFELPFQPEPSNGLPLLVNHASCLDKNGRILIVGGGTNCFSFGMHLNNSIFQISLKNIQNWS